jgi:hypothetical protein
VARTTSYTHPSTLQEKNGLCSPTLKALPILHFVLLPIFNCNTFLLQCSYTIWHFVIPLRYISNSQPNTHSIAIKKTVIPTTTTIPLLQYKNCQKHT